MTRLRGNEFTYLLLTVGTGGVATLFLPIAPPRLGITTAGASSLLTPVAFKLLFKGSQSAH